MPWRERSRGMTFSISNSNGGGKRSVQYLNDDEVI